MGTSSTTAPNLSPHARRRMRQRGISLAAVAAALDHGQTYCAGNGCLAYLLTRRVVSDARRRGVNLTAFASVAVIENPAGKIVTVEHVGRVPRNWEVAP